MVDTMVDWLSEVRKSGGEWAWIWKSRPSLDNLQREMRCPPIASILLSTRVKEAIATAAASGRNAGDLKKTEKEAEVILVRMAHQLESSSYVDFVKPVGYAVVKVIMRLYSSVYVNLARLKSITAHVYSGSTQPIPVVFLPTHRSYLDFLLITLLCYHVECPLPAIAAGEDFLASKLLGESLRRCGAFFLRRQFAHDHLYRALFAEYVLALLSMQEGRPLEFFIEGRRSRTLKSSHPKLGMLQLLVESFIRSEIFDAVLVPVCIDYDKLLEEGLYAYELLGYAKPKETTSGLFKARQALQQRNYGSVYVKFAEPLSLRKFFLSGGNDPRAGYSLQPHWGIAWDERERRKIRELAYHIIFYQNAEKTITVWYDYHLKEETSLDLWIWSIAFPCSWLLRPLVSACIMKKWIKNDLDQSKRNSSYSLSSLHEDVSELRTLYETMAKTPIHLHYREEEDLRRDIEYFIRIHADFIRVANGDDLEFGQQDGESESGTTYSTTTSNKSFSLQLPPNLLQNTLTRLTVLNYSNPLVASLIDHILLATALSAHAPSISCPSMKQTWEEDWRFLRIIFGMEFVFNPAIELDSIVAQFVDANWVRVAKDGTPTRLDVINVDALRELAKLILPYIVPYLEVVRTLASFGQAIPTSLAALGALCQTEIAKRIQHGGDSLGAAKFPAISLELISNVLKMLSASILRIANGSATIDLWHLAETIRRVEKLVSPLLAIAKRPTSVSQCAIAILGRTSAIDEENIIHVRSHL